MLILSSYINHPRQLEVLATALESCITAEVVPIVHIAGLPARYTGAKHGTDGIAELLRESRAELWSGGWVGAAGLYLTEDELAWDVRWAATNDADSGLARLLGLEPSCDLPVLCTSRQADHLRRGAPRPVALGYARPTPTPPHAGGTFWIAVNGRWGTIPVYRPATGMVPASAEALQLDITAAHPDTTAERVAAACAALRDDRRTAEWRTLITPASAPPREPFFSAGVTGPHDAAGPATQAAIAALRARRPASPDRIRSLLVAGSPGTPRSDAPRAAETAGNEGPPPNRFAHRELQGGVTGAVRLDGDQLGAGFIGGRLAHLSRAGKQLTPGPRSQGFVQDRRGVAFLETVSAAWFTGDRVRGIHETAVIPGWYHLETTVLAIDRAPGLVLNVRVETLADVVAAERVAPRQDAHPGYATVDPPTREAILEIPLLRGDAAGELTGAVQHLDGGVEERVLLPAGAENASDGAGSGSSTEAVWSVAGVAVRVDLAAGPLWITALHPGAVVATLFTFVRHDTAFGPVVSWCPLGFHRDVDAARRSWDHAAPQVEAQSATYRLTTATGAAVSPVPEEDLLAEIDGYSVRTTPKP